MHTFINAIQRNIGIYLYWRRLCEVMVAWDDMNSLANQPAFIYEFAEIWQSADKIVYSKILDKVSSEWTRVERESDPQVIQAFK